MSIVIINFFLIIVNILVFVFGAIGYDTFERFLYYDKQTGKNVYKEVKWNILQFDADSAMFFIVTIATLLLTIIISIFVFSNNTVKNKKAFRFFLILEMIVSLLVGVPYLIASTILTGYLAGISGLFSFVLSGIMLVLNVYSPKGYTKKTYNTSAPSYEDKIIKLKELRDRNVITNKEYEEKKAELITKILNEENSEA